MPRISDAFDNAPLGDISQDDLELLLAQLEAPSRNDRSCFVTNDTFLALVEAGASSTLLDAVKVALDRNPNAKIRWDAD